MIFLDGSIHRPGSTDLTSYYIYDQPVLAPADGTVTYLVDGHPDLPVGSVDSQHPTGNQLVIDIGGGHFLLMGHLRQGSITVHAGERVTEGQQIARVGKSGHTSHPHIHIQAKRCPPDRRPPDHRRPKDAEDPPHLPAAVLRRQPRAGRRRDPADGC
jgi:murein DD-endopeptidase MepM/ murein hydrolase activator NlpD